MDSDVCVARRIREDHPHHFVKHFSAQVAGATLYAVPAIDTRIVTHSSRVALGRRSSPAHKSARASRRTSRTSRGQPRTRDRRSPREAPGCRPRPHSHIRYRRTCTSPLPYPSPLSRPDPTGRTSNARVRAANRYTKMPEGASCP